jgi:hypothetical protein
VLTPFNANVAHIFPMIAEMPCKEWTSHMQEYMDICEQEVTSS